MYKIVVWDRLRVHRHCVVEVLWAQGTFVHLANLDADFADGDEEQRHDEDQEGGEHDGALAAHLLVDQLGALVACIEGDARRIADHLKSSNDVLERHPDPIQEPITNLIPQRLFLQSTVRRINTFTVVKSRYTFLTLLVELEHLSTL